MRVLQDTVVTVWDINDIELANVPVVHSFELTDDSPINSRARRVPPKHNDVVKIITPDSSPW